MNCKVYSGVEVFKVKAADQGGYFGLLAVNWNPQNEATINVDLVLIGVSPSPSYNCTVTNMWFPSIQITNVNGVYQITKIPPHGNAALKVACKRPNTYQMVNEDQKERWFFE